MKYIDDENVTFTTDNGNQWYAYLSDDGVCFYGNNVDIETDSDYSQIALAYDNKWLDLNELSELVKEALAVDESEIEAEKAHEREIRSLEMTGICLGKGKLWRG